MSNTTEITKYAASRALIELDAERASPDYQGDTARLPALLPPASDDTVPMLPALIRRQAG